MLATSLLQVSVVTEMFLDLSLPVSDEVKLSFQTYSSKICLLVYIPVPSCNILVQAYRKKNQKKGVQKSSESSQDGRSSPALTSTDDNIPTGTGSKYQQKKAKKQAKKQAKVFK